MVPCTYLCGKVHRCQLRDYIQGCIGNLQDSRPARLQLREGNGMYGSFRQLPQLGSNSELLPGGTAWCWGHVTVAVVMAISDSGVSWMPMSANVLRTAEDESRNCDYRIDQRWIHGTHKNYCWPSWFYIKYWGVFHCFPLFSTRICFLDWLSWLRLGCCCTAVMTSLVTTLTSLVRPSGDQKQHLEAAHIVPSIYPSIMITSYHHISPSS